MCYTDTVEIRSESYRVSCFYTGIGDTGEVGGRA